MKLSSRLFATIAFSFFIGSTIAQDLIYTISGELDSNKIALDSILFENLTNGKKLLFENLPDQNDYVINLTTQEQQGPTGIRNLTHENYFKLIRNTPGQLSVACRQTSVGNVNLSVYNIQGQKLYSSSHMNLRAGSSINVLLSKDGIYLVEIQSSLGSKTFKAFGSEKYNNIVTFIDEQKSTSNGGFKSILIENESDFNFEVGDSLRASVYRDGYYSRPKGVKITTSEPIDFIFEISSVDIHGVSDAYVDMDEETQVSMSYDESSGQVQLTPSNDTVVLNIGDIIAIDADTTGYLRKIIGITEENGELVLETEQAYLNDIFVDIDFKLNTKLIDPVGTLKSASSLLEISSALTDEYGYIHPVEIIFYDKQGIIHKKSALANNGSQEDTISIIDFFEDFSNTDIYGEEGDNIHFYIDEGHVSLVSDAVFELDFDYNGELTEDTKIKKGDIKAFKFYLDSRAEFLTKLALDMSYAYEDGDEITLLNFKKATAHFVVPPGIPVWITFDVDVYGNYHLNVDAALHADWGFESKHTLQVGGLYEKETNSFTPITEYTPENTIFPLNLNGEINASARLELFPRVEIKLYSVFGPYAEIVPFVEGNYNAAIQSQITTTGSETFLAWNSGLDLGLDLRVGTELSVLGIEKEFGPIVVNCFEYPLWRSPSNIELLTTLPAEAESGSRHTLTLKIRDLLDNPVALCPVYIDGDGVFSRYLSLTDIYGEVTIDWTLGNETGEQSMTITIYDASKNVIDVLTHNITTTGPSLDLIAHYHLNGDASDASGNGHDGLVNGATPTIDRFGNENSAYSFDGIDDEIVIPNSPDFNLLDGFTFSAWINPKSWGESSMGFVLCRRVSHTSENGGYIFGFNPSEFSIHFIGVDGTIGAQVTDQLDETFFNSFHFVTATYNGEELKLYIDNELVGTETGIISMSPTDIDLVIGNTSAQDQARSFDGIIDDIRIYNYELSESDISTLYYEGGWEGPGDPETSTFVDVRDGQEYALVEIGNQTWMAENLNYISTNSFYYNNDPSYGEIYGRLYTFDDAINVCPSGWHLPTDDEWKVLETELGMPEEDLDILDVLMTDENWRGDIQGRMMKEGGSSGLNLNLGGYSHTSSFYSMNEYGRYWSSSEYGETEALNRFFWSDSDAVRRRHNPKDRLFSVRYVKD